MTFSNVKGYNSGGDLVLAAKDDGVVLAKFKASDDTVELSGYSFGTKSALPHSIPVGSMKSTTGVVMTATPADNVWAELIASNVHGLTSNLADGGTKTAAGTFQYALPNNYIAAQPVTVKLTVKLKSVTGTGVANNGSDIDLSVYRQDDALATVGSDLVTTNAQTFAALDTVYVKSFTVDPATLLPGDTLNFLVTGRAIENDAGNGTLQVELFCIEVDLDQAGATAL